MPPLEGKAHTPALEHTARISRGGCKRTRSVVFPLCCHPHTRRSNSHETRHLRSPRYRSTSSGFLLLRGTIVNRTYGTHKKLHLHLFLLLNSNIWSYLLWSPVTGSGIYAEAVSVLDDDRSQACHYQVWAALPEGMVSCICGKDASHRPLPRPIYDVVDCSASGGVCQSCRRGCLWRYLVESCPQTGRSVFLAASCL